MADKPKSALVTRTNAELADNSADVYGRMTRHRMRAIVDTAFDMLTAAGEGKKRLSADGRDVFQCLGDAILADPIGALERLTKMLPGEPAASDKSGGNININQLYLAALTKANDAANEAKPITIDQSAGVQSGSDDW